jgi:DNA-binding LacI/PurR family transcriptional regulator
MELSEIRKQLPAGAIKEIAKRAKTSESTVSLIFKGNINSLKKQEVLQIAVEFITEYKSKEKEAKMAIEKAIMS